MPVSATMNYQSRMTTCCCKSIGAKMDIMATRTRRFLACPPSFPSSESTKGRNECSRSIEKRKLRRRSQRDVSAEITEESKPEVQDPCDEDTSCYFSGVTPSQYVKGMPEAQIGFE